MVGEEANRGTVTSSATCTEASTALDQRHVSTALSSSVEEQPPRLPTSEYSTEDEVIVETSDGSLFLLSRWRLAAESLFFRALFNGSYIDSKSSRVRLACIRSSDFRACLSLTSHIYRGTTPRMSADAAMDLMVTASFLQMSLLMDELVNTIIIHTHPANRLTAYRKATTRSAVLAKKLWNSLVKEFRFHINNRDYERMTESEILNALTDERLDIESREEEPLINRWIAMHPKGNDRVLGLKFRALRRGGLDGQFSAVIRDRVPREIILAIGGWSAGGPSDIVEVFNPRAQMWVVPDIAVREIPRAYHGLALCGGKIVIFGGFNGTQYFQHAKLFDLNRKSWDAITNMHVPRCYVAATAFTDSSGIQHVVAMGGYNGHRPLNSAEMLRIEDNHWCCLPRMSEIRSDAGAVVLDGRPTIIGGFDGRAINDDIEMLDFETQSWIKGSSPMRSVRTGASAVAFEPNSVMVVGGCNGVRRLKSAEFYDCRVGIWFPLPELETTRSNFGIEMMNGRIYVAGGFDGTRTTNKVERFDMRAYRWEALSSMSIPRSGLRLIRIADHEIIQSLINFQSRPFHWY